MEFLDIIQIGDKLEMRIAQKAETEEKAPEKPKIYKSQVVDFLDNGNMLASMPTEKGRLMLLTLGLRYGLLCNGTTAAGNCPAIHQGFSSSHLLFSYRCCLLSENQDNGDYKNPALQKSICQSVSYNMPHHIPLLRKPIQHTLPKRHKAEALSLHWQG